MPNLIPPLVHNQQIVEYRDRIKDALGHQQFVPAMTRYLTDDTDPDKVIEAYQSGLIAAVKLYPLHGTTNSAAAVSDISKVDAVLKAMEAEGVPLLIHGERPYQDGEPVDHYDREALYFANELQRILDSYPNLRISLEHISSMEAARFMAKHGSAGLVATITPHHLMTDRRYTMYTTDGACMPAIKAQEHKEELQDLVAGGCPWVHLGTDCAPHVEGNKNAVQCACGCFTGPHAIPMYLQAFDEAGAMQHFEDFASVRGPKFFGLEPATETVTYEKSDWQVQQMTQVSTENGYESIRPFGFRTPYEEKVGRGTNLTLKWKKAA